MKCPGHEVCWLKEDKDQDTCQRMGECQVMADVERIPLRAAREMSPYPQFCSMPYLCSTDGRCHRNPCCID